MTTQQFIQQLLSIAKQSVGSSIRVESTLVGVFQALRPHGFKDKEVFASVTGGQQFGLRLDSLYDAVRSCDRFDGMRDAYFIVRNPPALSPERAEVLGVEFIEGVLRFYEAAEPTGEREQLPSFSQSNMPTIRVLEGKPPKHPKNKNERAPLLCVLQEYCPAQIDSLSAKSELATQLSEALYFVACDNWLREYLRWPLFKEHVQEPQLQCLEQLLSSYFELWRHGVKYRVFSDSQVDFYLPRIV